MDISGRKRTGGGPCAGWACLQLDLCRFEHKNILGNIYVGKVKNIAENIRAAFIEIADGIMCYTLWTKRQFLSIPTGKKTGS